jgi:prepilin-type N-terminal cleavage/methylation domain-containing protein
MTSRINGERGFSLVESLVALGILTAGLLGLAAVLSQALSTVATSSFDQLAKDKAYEALENIVAARETKLITWDKMKNVVDGGVFLDGAQPITGAGADGIIGTTDDLGQPASTIIEPGQDEAYGTSDDVTISLVNYTRRIVITNASPAGAPDTLRQVAVTITFTAAGKTRQYTLTTLVSSYS